MKCIVLLVAGISSILPTYAYGNSILENVFGISRQINSTLSREIPPEKGPSRSCGDVISIATVEEIKGAAKSLMNAFLNDSSAALLVVNILQDMVQYDVQAQVVCGSCQDVVIDQSSSTDDNNSSDRFKPSFYCDESQFASNITYSNLLLIPIDPTTNLSAQGILKSHVFLHSYRGDEQFGAPSEFWLDDIGALISNDTQALAATFANFYDGFSSLLIASSGVVVVAPDYLGYGQSYQSPKGFAIVDLYQQAVAVGFLQSKEIVESTGCTVLSKETSTSGYSEGGIASVVAALTLEGLGQKILYVGSGGAPYQISLQMLHSIGQADKKFENDDLYPLFAVGMVAYSSNIPNLPNSNQGQNVINDDWLDLMTALASTSLTTKEMKAYIPDPVTEIVEANVLKKARELLAKNMTDFCSETTVGVDDLLCQTLNENSVYDWVEATTFPISICHSPNDTMIPISHIPNISSSPLLSMGTILGRGPDGDHYASSIFCHMVQILQFSSLSSSPVPLLGIESLTDPSQCAETPNSPSSTVPTSTPQDQPIAPTSSPISQDAKSHAESNYCLSLGKFVIPLWAVNFFSGMMFNYC